MEPDINLYLIGEMIVAIIVNIVLKTEVTSNSTQFLS